MDTSTFKKATFLTVLCLVAFVLSGGLYIYISLLSQSSYSDKNSPLNNSFGADYGLTNLTRTQNNAINGIASTTVSVTLPTNDSSTSGGTASLEELASIMKSNAPEQDIYNFHATSNPSDNTSAHQNFSFDASSPVDYKDNTFQNAVDNYYSLTQNSNFTGLSYSSTPNMNGTRSTNITATTTNPTYVYSGQDISLYWDNLLDSTKANIPTDGSKVNLTLTLSSGAQVTGTYFDQESWNNLKAASKNNYIWNQMVNYNSTLNANGVNLKSVLLTIAAGSSPTDSTLDLTLKGNAKTNAANISILNTKIAQTVNAEPYNTRVFTDGAKTPELILYPSVVPLS